MSVQEKIKLFQVEKKDLKPPTPINVQNNIISQTSQEENSIKKWTTEDVLNWLKKAQFAQDVISTFEENEVLGEDLEEMTGEDLKLELGIKKFGTRKKIMKELDILFERTRNQDDPPSPKTGIEIKIEKIPEKGEKSPLQVPIIKNLEQSTTQEQVKEQPLKEISPKKEELAINVIEEPKETPKEPPKEERIRILRKFPSASHIEKTEKIVEVCSEKPVNGNYEKKEIIPEDVILPENPPPLGSPTFLSPRVEDTTEKKPKLSLSNTLKERIRIPRPSEKPQTLNLSPRNNQNGNEQSEDKKEDTEEQVEIAPIGLSRLNSSDEDKLRDGPTSARSFSEFKSEKQIAIENMMKKEKERKLAEARSFTTFSKTSPVIDEKKRESQMGATKQAVDSLQNSIRIPNSDRFIKIRKEEFPLMMTSQGETISQLFRRGNKVLLIFLPNFISSAFSSIMEELYLFHRSLLQLNTVPVVVVLDGQKAKNFWAAKENKKYKKIQYIDDSNMNIRSLFRVEGTFSIGGLIKGNGLKTELHASFLIDNHSIINESRPRYLMDHMDFLKIIIMPEIKDIRPEKHMYNLQSGITQDEYENFDRNDIYDSTKYNSIIAPKYLKFSNFFKSEEEISLNDVVTCTTWVGFFRIFMARHLRLSLLLFYEHVLNFFKNDLYQNKRKEHAIEIQKTFLNENSIYYIEEPKVIEKNKLTLKEKIESDSVEIELFDPIVQIAFGLLGDYFEKFRNTELFGEMKKIPPDTSMKKLKK